MASILQLACHPQIVAIKQAVPDLQVLNHLLYDRPAGFSVLSGEDCLTLPMVAMGADGVISVMSNLAPGPMVSLTTAARCGDRDQALRWQARLVPLMNALFVESNPIPVKYALSELQLIDNVLRLPLTCLAEECHGPVTQAMARAGIDQRNHHSAEMTFCEPRLDRRPRIEPHVTLRVSR